MILGERAELRFRVESMNGEISVSKAEFVAYLDDVIQDSGIVTVTDNILSFIFEPQHAGFYLIQITYEVGVERRIARFTVEVKE